MNQLAVPQIIKRAAEQCGFKRVRYSDKDIPTTISNITVLLFLGDIRSSFILSSLILKRFKEESRGSRYFILCSWPGNQGLFPYVDEYWEIADETHLKTIYNQTSGFDNKSEVISGYTRKLNGFFEEVLNVDEVAEFYNNGFKQEFFDRYKHIKKFFPSIPSSVVLGTEFNRRLNEQNKKVVIYPVTHVQDWENGRIVNRWVSDVFWEKLVDRLLEESFTPVVYQNFYTYDLSSKFVDKCIYLTGTDTLHILAGMRATGCVLDLFSGISRLAIAARCPYVLCEDRSMYNQIKEYETDILCAQDIPKEIFYVFSSICHETNKSHWNSSLFDGILNKLISLTRDANRDEWPSPSEVNELVKYENAKKIKNKKMGTRFIKVPKY